MQVAFIVTTDLPADDPATLSQTTQQIIDAVAGRGITVVSVRPFPRGDVAPPSALSLGGLGSLDINSPESI